MARMALSLIVLLACLFADQQAFAATAPTTLALFGSVGAPGAQSGVAMDAAGNMYVTLSVGTDGAVVQVPKGGTGGAPSILHQFGGTDGTSPFGTLTLDAAGNLYGVTSGDGVSSFGTVFKLAAKTYAFTTLHAFAGKSDGATPQGGVVLDSAGNLYGTTSGGGLGYGTVFMLSPKGVSTNLYSFHGGGDGSAPSGPLLRDTLGNLYGTTGKGGGSADPGTVFKLTRLGTAYLESVLHSFGAYGEGIGPQAGVTMDSNGNLFGATVAGGVNGHGTVFELSPAGTAWVARVLYRFTGGADGAQPAGGVVSDPSGNLFGAANRGGANAAGVVFKLAGGTWTESVLYSFPTVTSLAPPGNLPTAGVLRASNGMLYGTTSGGGGIWHTGGVYSLSGN